MYRITSAASASMSMTVETISITYADGDAISGLYVQAVDDLGATHHFFQSDDDRVWLAAFPVEGADGDVSGTPVEMNRWDWAETIGDSIDVFLLS